MSNVQQEIRKPVDREYARGQIAEYKAECASMMRGEIHQSDFFIIEWEDCEISVKEYSPFLTDAELQQCFKKAQS